jgi:hypothetical protein
MSKELAYYNAMGVHLKKFAIVSPSFSQPSASNYLTTYPSIPTSKKPTSVAILLILLTKRRVMMEDVNVSNVKERWAKC